MANVLHANLTGADLHEPKGVASATANTVYKANGSGSGSWVKLTDTDMNYSDPTKNKFGWIDVSDGLYTSGSPRSITSGTRTQITNNGAAAQSDTTRLGALWNTTTNAFEIDDLNAAYTLRMTGKVKTSATAGTPYTIDFELESANGSTVIAAQTLIIKGGNHVNHFSLSAPFYVGSFINDYDLSIYVTADVNITLYDVGFILVRHYVES